MGCDLAGPLAAFNLGRMLALTTKQVSLPLFPSGKTMHAGCSIFHCMERTSLSRNDANTEKVELRDYERQSSDDI